MNRQTCYEIQLKGHLHPRWSSWLDEFDVIHLADGSTRLFGSLPDDAAVYGLLNRLRDVGAVLISLQRCQPPLANEQHPTLSCRCRS